MTTSKVKLPTISRYSISKNGKKYFYYRFRNPITGAMETSKSSKKLKGRRLAVCRQIKDAKSTQMDSVIMAAIVESLKEYNINPLSAVEEFKKYQDRENAKHAPVLIENAIEEYLDVKARGGFAKSTVNQVRHVCPTFAKAAHIKGRNLGDITRIDVIKYLEKIAVLKTRTNHKTVIRRFFNWCKKDRGYIDRTPVEDLPKYKIEPSLPKILSIDEIRRLLSVIEDFQPKLKTFVCCALFLGIRIEEIKRLKKSDFNFNVGKITIRGKVNVYRTIEMNDVFKRFVESGDVPAEPHVPHFRAKFDEIKRRCGYNIVIRKKLKFLEESKEESKKWHKNVLRHSYASYWIAKYKDVAVCAEHMGTSYYRIKNNYQRPIDNSDDAEKFFNLTTMNIHDNVRVVEGKPVQLWDGTLVDENAMHEDESDINDDVVKKLTAQDIAAIRPKWNKMFPTQKSVKSKDKEQTRMTYGKAWNEIMKNKKKKP